MTRPQRDRAKTTIRWHTLLAALRDRRVIPIVGPGIFGGDLPALTRARSPTMKGADRDDLHEELLAELGGHEPARTAAASQLAEITDFRLFLTTCLDPRLEQTLARERDERVVPLRYSLNPTRRETLPDSWVAGDDPSTLVYYLLGAVTHSDSGDYALSEEETLEFLHEMQRQECRPKGLFDLLDDSYILLLGCSFPDWLTRFFLRTLKKEALSKKRGLLIADARVHEDEPLKQFLEGCGLQLDDPRDVAAFVAELHERWAQQQAGPAEAAEPEPAPRVQGGATAFLSCASDDLETAQRVRDQLTASGLQVWLYEDSQQYGADWPSEQHKAIEACDIFIPMLSESTDRRVRAEFRREWTDAVEEAKAYKPFQFIWPIIVSEDHFEPEFAKEHFKRIHWAHAPNGYLPFKFLSDVAREFRRRRLAERAGPAPVSAP